jgi:hypothetical protein
VQQPGIDCKMQKLVTGKGLNPSSSSRSGHPPFFSAVNDISQTPDCWTQIRNWLPSLERGLKVLKSHWRPCEFETILVPRHQGKDLNVTAQNHPGHRYPIHLSIISRTVEHSFPMFPASSGLPFLPGRAAKFPDQGL